MAGEDTRPDVLAYPSPTTSRFLVFLATLIAAGAFIGNWVHTEVRGDAWLAELAACASVAPPGGTLDAVLEQTAAQDRCSASAERERALFSVAGAGFAAAGGVLLLFLAPGLLERRRRLRELTPALAQVAGRAGEIAQEVGVRRAPTLMIGPTTLRDAFTYGTPRHYRVALPPAAAVRWRDQRLFDPVMRHELAHLRHHDVPLAWLARSVWWVLAPLLLLPVVVGVAEGDLSLLPGYAWRAVVLAALVQVVSSALLRSREHDADLRAAQADPDAIAAVVRGARDPGGRAPWRRVLARHPSPGARLAVLERPERHARVTFLDGAVTGLLAGLVIPLVVATVTPLLSGTDKVDLAWVAAALVSGPLIAGSVGLGLCRGALVNRLRGATPPAAPVAAGLAAGLVLGHAASLAQSGAGSASLGPPGWLPAVAVLGAGATVVCAGLAELLADAAPRFRRPGAAAALAVLATAAVFTPVMWLSTLLETPLELGWDGVNAWLVTSLQETWVLACFALAAAAAMLGLWCARRERRAPAWLIERGDPPAWPATAPRGLREALLTGLITGLVAAAALALYRAGAGRAESDAVAEQRLYLFFWAGGCAGGVAALWLIALRPTRGAGAAVLGALVASLATIAGWLVLNTALGGDLTLDFVNGIAKTPLALGFVAVVVVALAGLVPAAPMPGRARILVTGAVGAAVLAVLLTDPARLTPFGGAATPVGEEALTRAAGNDEAEIQLYVTAFASGAAGAYLQVDESIAAIDADTTLAGPDRAARITREVVAPLQALLDQARAFTPSSATVADVHADLVATLESDVLAFERFAVAFATDDAAAFAEAQAAREQVNGTRLRWLQRVTALGGG